MFELGCPLTGRETGFRPTVRPPESTTKPALERSVSAVMKEGRGRLHETRKQSRASVVVETCLLQLIGKKGRWD